MLKSTLAGALVALTLCTASFAQGDGSQYSFSVSSATGAAGGQVDIDVSVDSLGAMAIDLQGWSFGICYGTALEIAENTSLNICSPVDAANDNNPGLVFTTQAVKDLNPIVPLFFNNIGTFYNGAGYDHPGSDASCAPFPPGLFTTPANSFQAQAGFSQAIVIDQNSFFTLAPGSNIVACTATVDLLGPAGTYPVSICNDVIGVPAVSAVVVENGASLQPNYNDGSVTILSPNFVTHETVTGILGDPVTTNILLTNVGDVGGLQISSTFDDSLVTLNSATAVGPAASACFFQQQPGAGPGELVIGLIMDYGDPTPCGQAPIPSGTDVPVIELDWSINPMAPAPSTSPLAFVDGLGSPAIDNKIIFPGGATETPNLVDGAINIVNFNMFIRGDCNNDGTDNIADGVYLLINLFPGMGGPPGVVCEDACDFNDDGQLDATDALQLFNWRLQPGLGIMGAACEFGCAPPPAPYPAAGLDPTPNSVDAGDLLGCDGDADDGLSTFP